MKSKQGKQNKKMIAKVKNSKASIPSKRNDDPEDDPLTSEEEMEVAKPTKKESGSTKKLDKKKQIVKEKSIQQEDSDDDDDDDEDDSNDEDDSDDEDDEDSEDDDDDDSDEDDDDDSQEDDDDKEEEKKEDVKPGQKRKAEQLEKRENKKAKLEKPKASDYFFTSAKSLFVRMTSGDIESSVIEKFFDTHGIKVQQVRRIGGRNFAYVDVNESQLAAALKLSGKKMAGKQVQILPANEKSEKTSEKAPKTNFDDTKRRTLFVKNFGFEIKDADIKAHFPLAQKVFAPRKMDGKLKGHGYVEFESEAVADKVMSDLQNSMLCGRAICLDYVGEKRQNTTPLKLPEENCKTLCVKQLNYKTTAEQLKTFFKKATEARIVKDTKTDKSKGFGFVVFDSHEQAEKALQNMQGKDLNGRNMVVSYALKKKSKPGKTKHESKKRTKKTSSNGSKNVKGSKQTKNRQTGKPKKAANNKSKKAVDGDSS